MAITTKKLLGREKENYSIVLSPKKSTSLKLSNKTVSDYTKSTKDVQKNKTAPKARKPSSSLIKDLKIINKKTILIDKTLKNILSLFGKIELEKDKSFKGQRRKKRENDLEKETDKEKKKSGISAPSRPKTGIMDWILNFLFWTVAGNLFFKFLNKENLNRLTSIGKIIFSIAGFIQKVFIKTVESLVNFIDFSYEKFDQIRGFIKKVGGEGALKIFDNFSGMLNKVINGAIILAILLSKSKGFGGGRGGRGGGRGRGGRGGGGDVGITGRRAGRTRAVDPAVARKYAERYGRDAAIKRFGKDGVKSLGGKYGRSAATNLARKGAVSILGKGGTKAVLKFVKPFLKRLPLIGGLIDFGLSVAMGEPLGRAAFKAIGATILGAIGTGFGGPVGAILGGFAGDWAGGKLYDIFFGNKNSKSSSQAKQYGGVITAHAGGGNVVGDYGRTLKVDKNADEESLRRFVSKEPPKTDPGKDIGGEDKIKELFKQPPDNKKQSPFDALMTLSKVLKTIPFIGGIMGAAIDLALGQSIPDDFYRRLSESLTSLYLTIKGSSKVEKLSSSFAGVLPRLAEGGTVEQNRSLNLNLSEKGVLTDEQIRKTIEHNFKNTIRRDLNNSINVIRKQLGLKPIGEDAGAADTGTSGGGGSADEGGSGGGGGGSVVMGTSFEQGLAKLLKSYEGLRTAAYPDPTHGWSIPTIGMGATYYPKGFRLSGKVKKGDTITEDEALWIKMQHIKEHRQRLLRDISAAEYAKVPDNVKAALESKTFNYGSLGSTLAGLVKEGVKTGNYKPVADYFRNTLAKHNGGINSWRRNDEAGLIESGSSRRAKVSFPKSAGGTALAEYKEKGGKATEGTGTGGGTGGSYTQLSNNPDAKRGSKLAGELGRYLDSKGLGNWGSGVHQHPEHRPWKPESGHSPGSLHYASKGARAIDVGGYGRSRGYSDQEQILAGVAAFNKMKGVKPVQLLKDGYPGHSDHVHIAYQGGGPIQKPMKDSSKYNTIQQYQNYGGSTTLAIKTIYVKV